MHLSETKIETHFLMETPFRKINADLKKDKKKPFVSRELRQQVPQ